MPAFQVSVAIDLDADDEEQAHRSVEAALLNLCSSANWSHEILGTTRITTPMEPR